jgi:hypothetical protein
MNRLAWSIGALAAALLGYEVALLRILRLGSYHPFAFLVVTVALLGFGVSGSLLERWRAPLERAGETALVALAAATALSMPVCVALAERVPVEARLAPSLLGAELGRWALFWALVALPFLVGATGLGLGLVRAGAHASRVYAANLVGSGLGALAMPLVMTRVAPAWLPTATGALALLAACFPRAPARARASLLGASLLGGVVLAVAAPPRVRLDPFKYGAHVERLARQGSARLVERRIGPRGVVELWRSPAFHELPFLTGGAPPPPLDALLVDGQLGGVVLGGDTPVVERTLMSLPYAFLPERPRVALLGERGGADAWLALRHRAAPVEIVQPDPAVFALLGAHGGGLLAQPGVHARAADPRHFVDASDERYHLVQLVSLEGAAAGAGGIAGLAEDALPTVEGIAATLARLMPGGLVSVCRGLSTPPRDEIKLLALFAAALRARGLEPAARVVVLRDFLGACMLVRPDGWSASNVAAVRRLVAARELTPVWFPGVRADELNQPDALPDGDPLHAAAARLFGSGGARLIAEWPFDVRPPVDDRPFFFDFFRWRGVGALRRAFGELWLTRVELGFLFVMVSLGAAVVGAAALLLAPALGRARLPGRAATAAAFGALGLGYLTVEMAVLSRLTRIVGDPVVGAAATLGAFLLLSGAAGLWAARRPRAPWVVPAAAATVAALALVEPALLGEVARWPASTAARLAAAALGAAPLALAMGVPMPLALGRLGGDAPALVPWAWAANGFGSVIAAALATAIGMTWGFSVAGALAAALYASAALLLAR